MDETTTAMLVGQASRSTGLLAGVAALAVVSFAASYRLGQELLKTDLGALFRAGVVTVVLTSATQVGMLTSEYKLAPNGQVNLQMAWTKANARTILDSWDAGQRAWIGFSVGLDMLFILGYGSFLAILSAYRGRQSAWAATVIGALGMGCALDVVEGIAFMGIVGNPKGFDERLPFVASVCASIKFACLAGTIAYVLRVAPVR